jgi:hypothetical protein
VHEPFETYLRASGYGSPERVAAAAEIWGLNRFEVPLPPFQKLLAEQMLAPFFVFQLFCVLLWCLDEYWWAGGGGGGVWMQVGRDRAAAARGARCGWHATRSFHPRPRSRHRGRRLPSCATARVPATPPGVAPRGPLPGAF